MFGRIADAVGGLFRARPPTDPAADRAARLEERLRALAGAVPSLPDVTLRALALADDPDCHFATLARVIETDAALTAGLLRVANSVAFAGGTPVARLDQALVRVGRWHTKAAVVSLGVKSLFRDTPADTRAACADIWEHGFRTADLCRRLNHGFRLGHTGEEFAAGLLHDIGRVVLAVADPVGFAAAGGLDPARADDPARERAAIGTDHAAVGGWFAEHIGLPTALVRAVRDHHDPAAGAAPDRLVALVAACDELAEFAARGGDPAVFEVTASAGLAALTRGWPAARRDRLFALALDLLRPATPESHDR